MADWDYNDYNEWEKRNPKIPFTPKPGEKAPFNPDPPKIDINPKKPKKDNKKKYGKIASALGALSEVTGRLADPGLNLSISADSVRSGEGQSRSGTAESGTNYWRSHKNDLAAGGGKISSPNDNEEDK